MTTDPLFAWHPLTPRVSLVRGNGANSVVIADRRDVLLVDTKETGFGGALRREVERVVRAPVTCVVSTHHHTDHAMGNAAFTADVPVIAQRRARDRIVARAARVIVEAATASEQGVDPFAAHLADLRDWTLYYGEIRLDEGVRTEYESLMNPGREALRGIVGDAERTAAITPMAEQFAPTETFESERELRIGGLAIELRHSGPGHTDGDVVVVVPSEGIVIASDLVYDGLQPFIDVGAGARTDEWIRRTDELRDMCDGVERDGRAAVVVPGHGYAAGAVAVARQRAYFQRLRGTMETALRAGMPRADAVRLVPPGLPLERAELLAINLGLVYDELDQTGEGSAKFSLEW